MKAFHLLAAVALLVTAPGCSSIGKTKCADETKITGPVAAFLASPAGLDCSNQEAIHEDLQAFMGTLNLCEAPPHDLPKNMTGPIGSLVCPPLVAWGISHFIDNNDKLKRWGCKGTAVKTAFALACQFIPI